VPTGTVEPNFSVPFQVLLRVANVVLPLFAEVHAINDTIHGIVAQVRVEQLNEGMELLRSQRAFCEQKPDRI